MRGRDPAWRAHAVINAYKRNEPLPDWSGELEVALHRLLAGRAVAADETLQDAWESFNSDFSRDTMYMWLLSRTTDEQIHKYLGVSPEFVDAYRRLFFDEGVFKNRLQLMEWISSYESRAVGAMGMKQAFMHGITWLMWFYFGDYGDVDPSDIQRYIAAEAFYRGKSNKFYGVTAAEAKETHKYFKTALDAARALSTGKSKEGVHGLLIRLLHKDGTDQVPAKEKAQYLS